MLNVHVRERDGNQSMINPNNIPAARWRHSALYHLLLQLANLFLRYTLLHKVESLIQIKNLIQKPELLKLLQSLKIFGKLAYLVL